MITYRSVLRSAIATSLFALAACNDTTTEPVGNDQSTLTITPITATVYEADAVTFTAVFRNAAGAVIPGAPVTWSVSDTLRAELGANGYVLALKNGTVKITAQSHGISSSYDLTIARAPIQSINVMLQNPVIALGDVVVTGVRVNGPGGRLLTGRSVAFSSDNPNVAVIDASGRVRGVSNGTANIRATSEGVVGSLQVQVVESDVILELRDANGVRVPYFVYGDTIPTPLGRQYHEVYLEMGTFKITGSAPVKYELRLHFAQYHVTRVNGQKVMEFVGNSSESDRGRVAYDARGDLQLTSDIYVPLNHTASPNSNGMDVRYRIPGTDEYYQFFFRRW